MILSMFYVNTKCTAQLTVIDPNGKKSILGPNEIPAGTRSRNFVIQPPCGERKVIFEAWVGSGSDACRAECTYYVRCGSSPEPIGCTNEYGCKNNVVRQLCYDEDGDEDWEEIYDCNDYNPPRECINGECRPIEPATVCRGVISGNVVEAGSDRALEGVKVIIGGGESEWLGKTNINGAFKSSRNFCPSDKLEIFFEKNGYATTIFNGKTDDNGDADVFLSLSPESLGTVQFRGQVLRGGSDETSQLISFYHFAIKVTEILEDFNGSELSIGSVVGVTSHRSGPARVDDAKNGDQVEVYGKCISQSKISETYLDYSTNLELSASPSDGAQYYLMKLKAKCSGAISGYVKDARSGLSIPGASLLICQDGGECWSLSPSDSQGFYSTEKQMCPATSNGTSHEITCSADGYNSDTAIISTDGLGNARQDCYLEAECSGAISGYVKDARNGLPIPGASLLICQDGGECWSLSPSDSQGFYSTEKQMCPATSNGTSHEITCSADGYNSDTAIISTDELGNVQHDFTLEPESSGSPPKEIKFIGTYYRGQWPMGFTVYYFKVDEVIEGPEIPIGDQIGVDVYTSSGPREQGGSAETLQAGEKAEIYTSIDIDVGKWDDGYETAWSASITGDGKYYIRKSNQCEGIISGYVKDKETGVPIEGARVGATGETFGVFSDKEGFYKLDCHFCPNKDVHLIYDKDGYSPNFGEMAKTDDYGNAENINLSLEKYESMRAIWVWNRDCIKSDDLINNSVIDELEFYGINTIFLVLQGEYESDLNNIICNKEKYNNFVKYAKKHNIKIYASILGMDNVSYNKYMQDPGHLRRIEENVTAVIDSGIEFSGILVDLEPHIANTSLLKCNMNCLMDDYKEALDIINSNIPPTMKLAVCISVSDYNDYISEIAQKADFFVIMAYDSENQTSFWNDFQNINLVSKNVTDFIKTNGSSSVIGIGVQENFSSMEDVIKLREDIIKNYINDNSILGAAIWDYKLFLRSKYPCCYVSKKCSNCECSERSRK